MPKSQDGRLEKAKYMDFIDFLIEERYIRGEWTNEYYELLLTYLKNTFNH